MFILIKLFIGIVINTAEPKKVSIPNIIFDSDEKIEVTAVIRMPHMIRIYPLFICLELKLKQNPDIKINVKQMLCCHM